MLSLHLNSSLPWKSLIRPTPLTLASVGRRYVIIKWNEIFCKTYSLLKYKAKILGVQPIKFKHPKEYKQPDMSVHICLIS